MRRTIGRLTLVAVLLGSLFACTSPTTDEPPTDDGRRPEVGSRVVFTGDFETGDFSQWSQCQNRKYSDECSDYDGDFYGARIVTDHVRQGEYAARFEVRDRDVPDWGGGERSEVSRYAEAIVEEGDERWYEFSLKFHEDFPDVRDGFLIVMQWHAGGDKSPPMALQVNRDGELVLVDNTDSDEDRVIGKVERGRWVDYVIHAKFSRSERRGWVEVYQDGDLVVPRFERSTMSSESNYLKIGIYRANSVQSRAVIWQDGLRITAP